MKKVLRRIYIFTASLAPIPIILKYPSVFDVWSETAKEKAYRTSRTINNY